ncbi:OsmC family protein [Hydrogenophaga sp. R2]|uniref:OsmC family protein n=1 Tax=Hydrogenophaga sp. R2 TaxID=3132827 RepID=UPI003CF809E0
MAHQYTAEILWERGDQTFTDNRYSRRHTIRLDGGLEVAGSSSPLVVPLPYSDPAAMDPEEAFVASLASCHMLWFFSIAVRAGFCVDRYADHAVGVMAANEKRKFWVSRVTLRPAVSFSGRQPTADELADMHHQAHEECFIANSVKTQVVVEPQPAGA